MADLETFPVDQTKRLISVESFAPGPTKIIVVSFEGVEGLSTLSRFRLGVVSLGRALKPSEILGQQLGIALRIGETVRKFYGIVSRFEIAGTALRDYNLHFVDLVPPAWLLTLNQRCRIFQNTKPTDVIATVLGEASVRFQQKSAGAQREYFVQHCESDFNLVSRLWEENGLFYRIDHSTPDCTLTVGDGTADYISGTPMTLVPQVTLGAWRPGYRVGASDFSHDSWDFVQVATLNGESRGLPKLQPPGLSTRQVYEYPGRHESGGEGDDYAKLRMEEIEAGLAWQAGSSIESQLQPGATYTVSGQSMEMPGGGQSGSYVATQVDHRAQDFSNTPFDGDSSYSNNFSGMPADSAFRPERATARPTICGVQTAIVTDGPDKYGRALVKFPWDQTETSRWTRVAQSWAYNKMGTQFFPRINSEVVVEYENGDPDHPVIVGMLYNGKNDVLYALPDNKTQSGIRGANWGTAGTPDVSNELRFEDKAGSEQIYIHAQKDALRVVTQDDTLTVQKGDRTIDIQQGNLSQTLDQGNANYTISQGNYQLNVSMGSASTTAMQQITLTVGQSSITITPTSITLQAVQINIQGQAQVSVQAPMTSVQADAMLTLKGGVTMIN